MAGTYKVELVGDVLKVGFGAPAQNDQIVQDCAAVLDSLTLTGGKLVKINGPASLPVACVLAHKLCHLFGAVAVFDPKLGKYVVAISHEPELPVGALIE